MDYDGEEIFMIYNVYFSGYHVHSPGVKRVVVQPVATR